MLLRDILYILFGYLLGGVLFARLFGFLLGHPDITEKSNDGNPGTANAFRYGGFLCGILTLCGDLCKGYLPVHLYMNKMDPIPGGFALSLVIAAPVLGHLYPILYSFRGGKGIAVSFGCMLGLLPETRPLGIIVLCFLFFTFIVNITPDYHKTLVVYIVASVLALLTIHNTAICAGFLLVAILIVTKLLLSPEKKEHAHVEVLWKR